MYAHSSQKQIQTKGKEIKKKKKKQDWVQFSLTWRACCRNNTEMLKEKVISRKRKERKGGRERWREGRRKEEKEKPAKYTGD